MDSPSSELSTSRSQSVIGGIEQLSVHGGAHGYSNTVDAYSSIRHHNSSGKTTHHPKQLVVTTGILFQEKIIPSKNLLRKIVHFSSNGN